MEQVAKYMPCPIPTSEVATALNVYPKAEGARRGIQGRLERGREGRENQKYSCILLSASCSKMYQTDSSLLFLGKD